VETKKEWHLIGIRIRGTIAFVGSNDRSAVRRIQLVIIRSDEGGLYVARESDCARLLETSQVNSGDRVSFTPKKRGEGFGAHTKEKFIWGCAYEVTTSQ
jgi:hypothetical protein